MAKEYPSISYPEAIKVGDKSYFPLPEIPKEPIKPQRTDLKDSKAFSISFVLAVIVGGSFGILSDSRPSHGESTFMVVFLLIIIGVGAVLQYSRAEEIRKKNTKFNNDNELYRSTKLKYETEKDQIELFEILNKNPIERRKYHENVRKEFFNKVTLPTTFKSKPGYSEDNFIRLLKQVLPSVSCDNFSKDLGLSIMIEDASLPSFNKYFEEDLKNPYQPDIAIYDAYSGLFFDIEIDEAYTLDSGKPIHYSDSDATRDYNISEHHGWCVIRISEKQIIENPIGCIRYIFEMIAELGDDQNLLNLVWDNTVLDASISHLISDVKSIKESSFHYGWTYEKALSMAQNNYRQELLGLKAKQYEPEDDLPF
jgi:F0F1-type ATP synthase assembly protein I